MAKPAVRISSISFHHYKALGRYSLSLDHINILTGANNSGKSTIIGAVRTLAVAMRSAWNRRPERVRVAEERFYGFPISENLLPISLENVATNYDDGTPSRISLKLSNGRMLHLHFSTEQGCIFVPECPDAEITTSAVFKSRFPLELAVVPVLGPAEHEERLRELSTVASALSTHRASRHFRNYWYHYPTGFDRFADLVKSTWPGMEIGPPELNSSTQVLTMFANEDRIDRELYWVGSGFQIWCQLLTHLHRATESSLIVVDEPEVYLHPDIQRRLLSVLKDVGPDILIATHSTEIVAEAEPSDIILVDKSRASGERLRDISGVQKAMDILGSQQNITLAALARNRRVLFVEGDGDFLLLRRFARRLGLNDLGAGLGLAAMPSGGFGSHDRIAILADGIVQALGTEILIGAIYDRDFFCDEQIEEVSTKLSKSLSLSHIHRCKEIENYLLVPQALDRALEKSANERRSRGGSAPSNLPATRDLLLRITDEMRDELEAQYIGRHNDYFRHSKIDSATLTMQASKRFRSAWADFPRRMDLVSGKDTLKRLREHLSDSLGLTLSDAKIVDSMRKDEIHSNLAELLHNVEKFRTLKVL